MGYSSSLKGCNPIICGDMHMLEIVILKRNTESKRQRQHDVAICQI